ncbi:MAG: hypothetical protein EBS12_00720 [Flavobacteriia bacterium]|nr:hypothetical protein [Flavobacteriia bacterium]
MNFFSKSQLLTYFLVIFFIELVVANDTDSTRFFSNKDSLNKKNKYLNIRFYSDVNYAFDLNRENDNERPFGSNPLHVNQFDIGYAFIEGSFHTDRFRSTFAINHGGIVDKMYENEPMLLKRIRELSSELEITKNLGLEFGIMPAYYGYEGFINKDNWFLSRAVMTDFAPDFDMGARLNYKHNNWRFKFQVANGWQTLRETNHNKTIGTLVRYETEKRVVNWGTMTTNESKIESLNLRRYYSNFFTQFKLSEKNSVAFLWDIGCQRDSVAVQTFNLWTSGSVYYRHKLNDTWTFATRIESFYDPHQIIPEVMTKTLQGFQFIGSSLGIDYHVNENSVLRFECRYAYSKDAIYPYKDASKKHDDLLFMLSGQFDIQVKKLRLFS